MCHASRVTTAMNSAASAISRPYAAVSNRVRPGMVSAAADEWTEPREQLRLREVAGLGERGERLGIVEVFGLETDHVRRERLVHLGLDVDVAHAHLAGLGIEH